MQFSLFAIASLALVALQALAAPIFVLPGSSLTANVSTECALNRLTIVTSLIGTKLDLKELQPLVADNKNASDAVKTAIEGVSIVQGGVGTIITALTAGQKPPADARQVVIDGLNKAAVIRDVECTKPDAMTLVAQIVAEFNQAGVAGDGVLATCT